MRETKTLMERYGNGGYQRERKEDTGIPGQEVVKKNLLRLLYSAMDVRYLSTYTLGGVCFLVDSLTGIQFNAGPKLLEVERQFSSNFWKGTVAV